MGNINRRFVHLNITWPEEYGHGKYSEAYDDFEDSLEMLINFISLGNYTIHKKTGVNGWTVLTVAALTISFDEDNFKKHMNYLMEPLPKAILVVDIREPAFYIERDEA